MIREGFAYQYPDGGQPWFPVLSEPDEHWTVPVVVIDRASAYAALRYVAGIIRACEEVSKASSGTRAAWMLTQASCIRVVTRNAIAKAKS